jgi:CelD/BcsL family acetyltransferase involved in cellulose biosynthesis
MANNSVTAAIKWLLIEDLSDLKNYTTKWSKLVEESDASLFSSPRWIMQWIEIYWQPNWQLKTIIGIENNQLIAVVPLYLQRSAGVFSLSTLIPLGQGEPEVSEVLSEYQDIIIHPQSTDLHTQLAEQISKIKFDQLYWCALLSGANCLKVLTHFKKCKHQESGQRYLLTKNKSYLSTLSKNNKNKWNKCKNKLAKLNAEFIWVSNSEFEHYWQTMISFHQNRWNKKEKKGAFFHQDFLAFHQNFQKNNSCRISALLIDNKPIAINYYLQNEQTLYFYQCGWNESEYAHLSPGFSLHIWSIINNPLNKYDFMMGGINDNYKKSFNCNNTEKMLTLTINNNSVQRLFYALINKISDLIHKS